ncbi:MAG TPA: PDZ domain-containing protein [Tepidisphaeraceae bacterium]
MIRLTIVGMVTWSIVAFATGEAREPLLLQTPTLSKTQVAFVYGGEIWTVSRDGGPARRLVTGSGRLSNSIFSPDGSQLAYAGDYDGNQDVYVVPAEGGEPRRLTYHPDPDVPLAWSPDGKNILIRSHRASNTDSNLLFTLPATDGFPKQLPLPMGEDGCFSPDGSHLAYVPVFQWEPDWKNYHGGQTTPIWIADLADSSIQKIPRDGSDDKDPMWVGDTIYFLSNRNGPVTLFAYDTESRRVRQVVKNDGFDIKWAAAGPGAIVYVQFGAMHLLDLATGESKQIHVTLAADMPEVRPHFEKVADHILNASISPTGKRAVFEAHGQILTVPAEKGDVRNITRTPAVANRDPAWSPDGKSIAWFSDESGEYALHIADQSGMGKVRKISLGDSPSFFYSPAWSPDGKKIAYHDKRLNLWCVDADGGAPAKLDTDLFDVDYEFDATWSPDSRWLAYTKQLSNHLHAAFVYSLDSHQATQITDGMSDVLYPQFDKGGKYLYFTASTNMGLSPGGLDMTSDAHPVTRNVYVAVLSKDTKSPLAPESDDEKAAESAQGTTQPATRPADADEKDDKDSDKEKDKHKEKGKDKDAKPKTPPKVTIDFENIDQRVLALPIPARNYQQLSAGKEGVLFLLEGPTVFTEGREPPPLSVQKFELKNRKTEKLLDAVTRLVVSFDGEHMLGQTPEKKWFIAATDKGAGPGQKTLKTDDMEVFVDPAAEWRQMYHEVWRIERDFFYDPHFHGLNLPEAESAFAPYLDRITSRNDLNYLFREMLSYMSVGHMFVNGGKLPDVPKVDVGLLGADYTIANDRYRFEKIFNGQNWNPNLHAPLTQPGLNVKAGDYLLAVNGRELHAGDNLYSFFQETAGKQTVIKVGPNPTEDGSRDVIVVPIASEGGLRHLDWIESNRRKVDQLSGGKLAYVYLPDTGRGGFTNFNRYYFAQVGKQGAIIDERYNHGGQIADYIVDLLNRPPMANVMTREGKPYSDPYQAIFGPKVMIINQFAGSGGDAMPWYFRKMKIGPLVGVKTWGGLVGIGGYPDLIDGGHVTAPRDAIYGLNGNWEVENHGIAPDIEVEMDPKLAREGHDPQLERAVKEAMDLLEKSPPREFPKPAYPDYKPRLPGTEQSASR